MKKRKRVYVRVNPSAFQYLFKPGRYEIAESSIPKDAKYLGTQYDWQTDSLLICFEHKSFNPISEGVCLPIIEDLTITRID
ncbi:unnamed protein product [marine sediment metagenome]|uniref:Uncharacterized protein n=1 Tax=marine sediment metagenome TaxID=412755 RepID=X1C6V8_9ZZZZ